MLGVKVWRRLLGVDDPTVIERVEFDEESDAVVAHVRPRGLRNQRCGRCGWRAPGYDQGEGRRRWRALDLGELRSFLEAEAPRVPRARADGHPGALGAPCRRPHPGFDDTVAWLAVHTSKTAIVELLRIAWATVGAIVARVVDEARRDVEPDRFEVRNCCNDRALGELPTCGSGSPRANRARALTHGEKSSDHA